MLITGGTGSLGSVLAERLLKTYPIKKIVVFSRDELKQLDLRNRLTSIQLRLMLGDVRDKARLAMAMDGIDVVIHTAALKQVASGEYDPIEVIKTNVIGSQNVIETAIEKSVSYVMGISTDKCVHATNLYGMTKGCMERLFVQGGVYSGVHKTKFACVRYGNVVGSRGSVIRIFREQMPTGTVTITSPNATRFWITLPQAVDFVMSSIAQMNGGEIFVPKLRAASVAAVFRAMTNDKCKYVVTGLRSGEKMHEVLLSEEELDRTEDIGDRYVVTNKRTKKLSVYASNLVEQMPIEEIRQIIDSIQ